MKRLTLSTTLALVRAVPAFAQDKPGEGVMVRPVASPMAEELFQACIIYKAPDDLDYTIEPGQVEIQTAHLAVGTGDADFYSAHWETLHTAFFEESVGDAVLQKVGPFVESMVQGYLVDKAGYDAGVKNLGDLKDAASATNFDANGDSTTDLAASRRPCILKGLPGAFRPLTLVAARKARLTADQGLIFLRPDQFPATSLRFPACPSAGDVGRGHQVQMCTAAVLGDGDFFRRPAGVKCWVIVEIGDHVGFGHHPGADRIDQFADVVHGGRAGIHEHAGAGHGPVVHFAHRGRVGPDQVKVLAGLQPVTLDKRGLGHRRTADYVRRPHRHL
jgi:Substrate binding domain of ABC-type glycine betaine transport system